MAPPRITTILRRADDWVSWLQQVNAYASSLDWKDYLTHEAGFSPPAPPTPPPVDGMRGSQKLLEWSYDRERSKYDASKAEYETFLVAVKRSVDPSLNVGASGGEGFKEFFEHVKARLDIDNVIEKPKLEGVWRVLMEQSLEEMSMKWADKVVEAYRFLRELGSSLVNGWDPYLEFVDNINKDYPIIAPAIYFRVYDMQRRQEKRGVGDPAGSVFEEFVQINVAMISRLAKPDRQKMDNSRSKPTTDATSGSPGTDKRGAESSVADLSRHKQQQQGAVYPSPKTCENKVEAAANPGDTAEQKEECDGALKRPAGRNPDELKDILVAKTLKLDAQGKASQKLPATNTGTTTEDHKNDGSILDTPIPDSQPRITLPTTSKQESTNEKKHERGLQIPTLITDDRKKANKIVMKRKLEHEDTFPVTIKKESAGDQEQGKIRIISKGSFNGRAQDSSVSGSLKLERLGDKPKITSQPLLKQEDASGQKQQVRLLGTSGQIPDRRKHGTVPPTAPNIMTREQKPRGLQSTTSNEENKTTQHSRFDRSATPKLSDIQQYRTSQSPTPTAQRDYRKEAPTKLKRKNEEEHEKRPGAPEHLRISLERREHTSGNEDLTCYICFNTNHSTMDCRLLERYRKHGEYAKNLGKSAMERCRRWLVGDSGGWYCRVCLRGGHDTEKCIDLRAYRKYGEKTWGMEDSTKDRCEEILREEADRYGS